MASEIVQDADAAIAAALAMELIEEVRPAMAGLPNVRVKSIEGMPTMAEKFGQLPQSSVATGGAITDGTAMSNTGIAVTSNTITAAAVGLGGVITDHSKYGSILTPEVAVNYFMRGVLEKVDTDITALFPSFTTNATVGTSGAAMTLGNFQTAQYELELAKAPGDYVTVLHTIQLLHLRQSLIGTAGALWANPSQAAVEGVINVISKSALKGVLLGVPIFQSPTCTTANAGADRVGGMFVRGDDLAGLGAIGFVWKWPLRSEQLRQPLYPGAQIAATAAYGTGIIQLVSGVQIVTSAT